MASELGKWLRSSKRQQSEIDAMSSDPQLVALVQGYLKGNGRTSGVRIHCGNHSTGWFVSLTLTGGFIDTEFRREKPSIPVSSLRVLHLVAVPRSGSLRLTCPTCGRAHARELPKFVASVIGALGNPTRRSGRKFVRIDRP